jgi:hypothetical protein
VDGDAIAPLLDSFPKGGMVTPGAGRAARAEAGHMDLGHLVHERGGPSGEQA